MLKKASHLCWLVVALGCLGVLEAKIDWLEFSEPDGETNFGVSVQLGWNGGAARAGGGGDGAGNGEGAGGGEATDDGGGGEYAVGFGGAGNDDAGANAATGEGFDFEDKPCPSPESDDAGNAAYGGTESFSATDSGGSSNSDSEGSSNDSSYDENSASRDAGFGNSGRKDSTKSKDSSNNKGHARWSLTGIKNLFGIFHRKKEDSSGGGTIGGSGSHKAGKGSELKLKNIFNVISKQGIPDSLNWLINYIKSYDDTIDSVSNKISNVIKMPQERIYKIIQAVVHQIYNMQDSTLTNIFGDTGVVHDLLDAGNQSISCVIDSTSDLPGKIERELIGCPAKMVKRVTKTLTTVVNDFRLLLLWISKAYNKLFHCPDSQCRIEGIAIFAKDAADLLYNILQSVAGVAMIASIPVQLPVCFTSSVITGVVGELMRFARDTFGCFRKSDIL